MALGNRGRLIKILIVLGHRGRSINILGTAVLKDQSPFGS